MTDFNPNLHPKDRRGRWRDALARALGPDPLGNGAASGLLRPPHRTGSTPSAEVAALRHLRPGQTIVLPHGTRVTRPLDDLQDPREFHVEVPASTVARREEAVANGVPDLAGPPATMAQVSQPRRGYALPADPGSNVEMSPGRAEKGELVPVESIRVGDTVHFDGFMGTPPSSAKVVKITRHREEIGGVNNMTRVAHFDDGSTFPIADYDDGMETEGGGYGQGEMTLRPSGQKERVTRGGEMSPGRVTPHNASLGREYAEADRQHREALHGHGDVAAAKARRDAAAAAIDGSLTTNATRAVSASMASPGRVVGGKASYDAAVAKARREAEAKAPRPRSIAPDGMSATKGDGSRAQVYQARDSYLGPAGWRVGFWNGPRVGAADSYEPVRSQDDGRRALRAWYDGNRPDLQRSPGRAGPPRTRPRTVVEMTRRDAGLVAKEIGQLKMYGDGPSPPKDFFGQLARSGDPGERMKLRLGDSTYGVARDAIADAMENRRTEDVARIARALGSAGQESPVEMSRGRVRRPPLTREERAARVRAAQAGPRPEPVGDIFTAINGAIETLRHRREATASPGRAQPEPDFPEGGVSIVSGGYRMGPYGTWEQAADQLLRERRSGSKAAHARAGLVADRDLSPEQTRHLVELAAKRALAVQEAARRDREQLAAIILRG